MELVLLSLSDELIREIDNHIYKLVFPERTQIEYIKVSNTDPSRNELIETRKEVILCAIKSYVERYAYKKD